MHTYTLFLFDQSGEVLTKHVLQQKVKSAYGLKSWRKRVMENYPTAVSYKITLLTNPV